MTWGEGARHWPRLGLLAWVGSFWLGGGVFGRGGGYWPGLGGYWLWWERVGPSVDTHTHTHTHTHTYMNATGFEAVCGTKMAGYWTIKNFDITQHCNFFNVG